MTKERTFQKSYFKELLSIARADLEAARILAANKASRKEIVLFQVEQAIEKGLKAYLVKLGIAVPLTHDLSILIDRFPLKHPIPHTNDLDDLIQFATIRRYEEGSAILTEPEVTEAIRVATEILDAVEKA